MARSSESTKVSVWRERFARFDALELKTAEFCLSEGVSQANFYAWRRKLGLSRPRAAKNQPRTSKQSSPSAFQQVVVSTAPALAAQLPGGVQLEASGANEQALRVIVNELVRATREVESC